MVALAITSQVPLARVTCGPVYHVFAADIVKFDARNAEALDSDGAGLVTFVGSQRSPPHAST
jgi:hypothetical protein